MSILHRILVSKHKHKRVFVKRKVVYKKFIGLKTFKNVLRTKFSIIGPKPAQKRKRIIKKVSRKTPTQVVFPRFNHLSALEKRREAVLAQVDIANFKTLKAEPAEEQISEEKFQAFLPQSMWEKMSSEQRRNHIKKRKLLAVKRENKSFAAPRYNFSNKKSRPSVTWMSFARRRHYLKNLIKVAATNSGAKPAPFIDKTESKLSRYTVKSTLRLANKIRASRRAYKDLTYTSLVPGRVGKLTL